jgi:hypothetical protein
MEGNPMNAPLLHNLFSAAQGIHHAFPGGDFDWSEPALAVTNAPSITELIRAGIENKEAKIEVAEGYRDISFALKRAILGVPDQWKSVDLGGSVGRWHLARLTLPKGMILFRTGGPLGWKLARFSRTHRPHERTPDYPHVVVMYDDAGAARFMTLIGYACVCNK